MNVAPPNTLTKQENIMFEEMEMLNKNLRKGMERWLEQDLQHRGRTQEEMQEMTLNRPSENDRGFFMIPIESCLDTAFDELFERTCKDLIQKWNHEGGKRDFAIGVIIEMLKDKGQLEDEQDLKTLLQNIDDWKIIKKLMGLAALAEDWIFVAYTALIEGVLNSAEHTREDIIMNIRLLIYLQLGENVMKELTPAIEKIADLQELKQVFIAAARAPNLLTLRQAHPELQNTEKVERSSPAQQ